MERTKTRIGKEQQSGWPQSLGSGVAQSSWLRSWTCRAMKSLSPNSAAGQKTQSWHQAQDRARYTPMHKTLQSSFHPQSASSGCGGKKSAIGVEKPSCELVEIPKIEAQWELSTLSTRLRAVVIQGCLWMPSKSVLGRHNETVHQGVAGKGQEGPQWDRGNGQPVGKALALSCRKIRNALCCTKDPLQKRNHKNCTVPRSQIQTRWTSCWRYYNSWRKRKSFCSRKEEESRHKLWLRERLLPQKEWKKAFEMVEGEYLATS